MVQGKGRSFLKPNALFRTTVVGRKVLPDKITDTTIAYESANQSRGCGQLFDSWAGLMSPMTLRNFLPILKEMAECTVPNILFAKGSWYALEELKAMEPTL